MILMSDMADPFQKEGAGIRRKIMAIPGGKFQGEERTEERK